MSLLSEMLG